MGWLQVAREKEMLVVLATIGMKKLSKMHQDAMEGQIMAIPCNGVDKTFTTIVK